MLAKQREGRIMKFFFDKPAPFVISIFFTTEKEKLVVSTFEISISVQNSFCPKSFYGIPQKMVPRHFINLSCHQMGIFLIDIT